MKAIWVDEYGDESALRIVDRPVPVPGPGEVLVRVRAVSLNAWDAERLTGRPRAYRLAAQRRPSVHVLGADAAGTVERVGAGVDGFAPGDAVVADLSASGWGGLAEYASAPAGVWTRIPSGVGFEQAAAIPQAGALAWQGLVDRGRVRPGERVLVIGAGGGVGTFAVQLAKQAGAIVTALDSAAKLDALRPLGADELIDRSVDWTAIQQHWDVILDPVAFRAPSAVRRALALGARYVVIGGRPGRLLQIAIAGSRPSRKGGRLSVLALRANAGVAHLLAETAAGRLAPAIDGVHALDDTAAAFRRLLGGEHLGKVVVSLS